MIDDLKSLIDTAVLNSITLDELHAVVHAFSDMEDDGSLAVIDRADMCELIELAITEM